MVLLFLLSKDFEFERRIKDSDGNNNSKEISNYISLISTKYGQGFG